LNTVDPVEKAKAAATFDRFELPALAEGSAPSPLATDQTEELNWNSLF
jgi:hypothetical protein